MTATRYMMSTPDKVLAIDAPATAEGVEFLVAHRRRDKRFARQTFGAYVPYGGGPPLYAVYVLGTNPFFSGVKIPKGNAHERRIAVALLEGRADIAAELRLAAEAEGRFVNSNVLDALVLLGRGKARSGDSPCSPDDD